MKALASLALIGLTFGAEDNEYFRRPVHIRRKVNTTAIDLNINHHNSKHIIEEDHASAKKHLNEKSSRTNDLSNKKLHESISQLDDEELFEVSRFFGKLGSIISNKEKRVRKPKNETTKKEIEKKEIAKKGTQKNPPQAFDDEFFPIRVRNNTKPIPNVFDDIEFSRTNGILKEKATHHDNNFENDFAELKELVKEGLLIYKQAQKKKEIDFLNGIKKGYFTPEETNDNSLFHACYYVKGKKVCHNK